MEDKISNNDIREWLDLEVTKEFFERVQVLIEDSDRMIHKHLESNQLQEAAYFNAGKTQLEEVLNLPELMKED